MSCADILYVYKKFCCISSKTDRLCLFVKIPIFLAILFNVYFQSHGILKTSVYMIETLYRTYMHYSDYTVCIMYMYIQASPKV